MIVFERSNWWGHTSGPRLPSHGAVYSRTLDTLVESAHSAGRGEAGRHDRLLYIPFGRQFAVQRSLIVRNDFRE